VQHRLRRAHDDHEIGLDERTVDPQRRVRRVAQRDELRVFDVVHDHVPVKAAGELGGDERFELSLRRAARKTRDDENRLVPGRDSVELELVDDGGDRMRPGIVRRAGDRQRRRLHHDRRARPAARVRLEAVARERETQRIAYRGPDVGDSLCGGRRTQDDGVVGSGRKHEPRPGEQRNARHPSPEAFRPSAPDDSVELP
jgi:hypothetical protein